MMSTTEELDIEISRDREEGELEESDVEEGTYIPLARPEAFNPPSLVNMQIQDEQSDEASAQESSCSDSDEELRRRAKRTKVRPRRAPPPQQPDKKEKYNIWSKALQEELLTEDMVSCDVSKKRRLYGVESYDYTIQYRLDDNNFVPNKILNSNAGDRTSNKRCRQDRSNVKLRLGKRVNSHHFEQMKQEPKYLENLTATPEDTVEVVSLEIADKLNEEKKELIGRIVQVLGTSKAIEIYKETQRLEADGGLLVMNGTRRRTPGGIYFFLLKRDDTISQEMIGKIFTEDRKEHQRKIKRTRQSRQKVMEQLKQSLTGALSADSELPSLSRGESTVQSEHGSNPPPSPATDARDGSSDTDGHSHTDGHLLIDAPINIDNNLHNESHLHSESHLHNETHLHNERPPRPEPTAHDDDDFLEVMCNDDMDLF